MSRPSFTIRSIRYWCLIYLMRCVFLIICYTFTSPRQFRLFCDVNSTSYGPCPLNDGRGFDRPRRRIFSGIHRRCHRDKACPPSLVKKKKKKSLSCCHSIWRIVPISFPLYQMQCVSSRTFCSIYHMRFGLLCGDANFVTFWYLSECRLTSFCHSHFFPFFSPHQHAYFLPHRLISIHQAPVVMAKLHLNLQYFPRVFQEAAVSHINARHALRQTKLNWSTL